MATKQAQYASPQETANRTFRIPLLGTFQNRTGSTTKDQRLINCYPEVKRDPITEQKKPFLVKRPGLSVRRSYTAGTARGSFRWKGADYVAIGDTVYKDAVVHQAISGTSGNVGFVVADDRDTEKLFFCDGTNGFLTNGTTVTQVPSTYSVWTADTVMAVGDRRIPVAANGFFYEVISVGGNAKTDAATEPVWPVVINDQISDNNVVWRCAGYYGFAYSAWSTPRTPLQGAQVIPTVPNGFYYECTVSGAVGGTEPVWPTTVGNTVVDGAATWLCVAPIEAGAPMPKFHLPYPVFLDKTLYLIAKDGAGNSSQSIYSSGISNPSSWNQVDFTDAEQYPDVLVMLLRHHNYIAAFGTESLEFFYDAANPTGSPISRNESLSTKIGCPAPDAAKQSEKLMVFVGTSTNGGYGVWQIDDFTPKKVSDEFADRILNNEGTSIVNAKAFFTRVSGHLFYVLNLSTRTLVYDTDEKIWHEWSINSGGNHINFVGGYSHDLGDSKATVLGNSDGKLYTLDPDIFQDAGIDILYDVYTTKLDFESISRKFLHRFSIFSDEVAGQSVSVRWTDDDYTTWTNYISISLSASPIRLYQLGAFRRRAFNIRYTGNTAFRIEGMEVNLSLGNH